MDVSDDWSIWKGVISHNAQLSLICNECKEDTDCNLNGVCIDKKCSCTNDNYYGLHWELERPCPRLIGQFNVTWSLLYNRECKYVNEYSRPVYVSKVLLFASLFVKHTKTYTRCSSQILKNMSDMLNNGITAIDKNDVLDIVFTGSRWVGIKVEQALTLDEEDLILSEIEYHA